MHGIIHLELQKFVTERYGDKAYRQLLEKAGLGQEIFTPLQSYPDEWMLKLVGVAVELTQVPEAQLLEAFGEYLVNTYLSLYGNLLKREWRTLDVIEHTEETIHRVVRMRQPGAQPPLLRAERTSPNEVVLFYDSPRRLCAVARGIGRGVANHFQEPIVIEERRCMHRGDPGCVIAYKLKP
ncbi:MAG TPA: heme NO-binding domain-containing protein [Polyangiaceae bacterium]|nr:heme NO-binding domain-containing protein [Polyangiaceae bacterium]